MMAVFLVLLVVLLGAIGFYNFYWKRRNLPPGPPPLPVLGNILQILWYGQEHAFTKLPEIYGEVYTFWIGETPFVMFNSMKTLQQYFIKQGDAFSGRPAPTVAQRPFMDGKWGVIHTNGPLWREQRRFTLRVLRDFGMGKNLMQERILDEVNWLIEKLKATKIVNNVDDEKTKGVDLQADIDLAVGSIINSITFGYRFTDDEHQHEFREKKERLERIFEQFNNFFIRLLGISDSEWLMTIPSVSKAVGVVEKEMKKFKENARKQIREHEEMMDVNSVAYDYVDAFLKEMKKFEATKENHIAFCHDQLSAATLDIWIAGQETTTTTLAFGFLYLVLYPECQKQLQAEFDRIIGSDRLITVADKPHLPYASAVLTEIQRCTNLLPFNVPHRLEEPVVVGNYVLPANTLVVPQLSAVMHNRELFSDPQDFRPDRFIDDNGNFVSSPDVLPFGVGKRACAGEALARMELFLFVTNVVNQFTISAPAENEPKKERIPSFSSKPYPYHVILNPRF